MLITRGKRTQQNLIDDINNQITSINQSINDMEIQSSSRNSTYIHSFLTPKKEVNCALCAFLICSSFAVHEHLLELVS